MAEMGPERVLVQVVDVDVAADREITFGRNLADEQRRLSRRIAGLRLQATDAEWAHGDGPEVSGPLLSLILAMTGRKAVHPDLSGDGVAELGRRP